MMTVMLVRQRLRLVLLGALLVALLAVVGAVYVGREPRAEVIDASAGTKQWKTLEYEGVTVDIPSSWERLDLDDCEFRFERWGPPDVPPCDPDTTGVAFYGSATFDPELGPGVITNDREDPQLPDWEGYVIAGDLVVHASDPRRAVVENILDSAD